MVSTMHENYLVDAGNFEKIYNELNEEVALDEKSKSKSQQRFFGQVDAVQKGDKSADDVSPEIAKAAKDMKHDDLIKQYYKANGRRCGKDFLEQINRHIATRIEYAVGIKNGGKQTLDRSVACHVGFKGLRLEEVE